MLASKELFQKNLASLNDGFYTALKMQLQAIKQSEFKLICGKDSLDINIKDTSKGGGA
ncbi:motility accessory factor [Campylobacter sp. MIT 12-8780]|uniref:motility accessory factor n=1 Tax=unclassified Campylobacter TaxID=2593542 RepID=UPI00115EF720|nr:MULTISPECIES: motility accessory factor [unclassified Campylobacter]NDJ26723.1 motility accessory factor [Campylobacter sp. MIT 19-121]TQR42450.1 motility accessory factor [Campylobacter sp. MIT 12-8780]